MDSEQERIDFEQRTLYDHGSAFNEFIGDTPRCARVFITRLGKPGRDETTIHTQAYQTLLGALRDEERRLQAEINDRSVKPGAMSIGRERIQRLERQRQQVLDLICTFDL